MEFVTGRSRNQIVLLPDSIEEYVGEDNAVRVIGAAESGNEEEHGSHAAFGTNPGHPMTCGAKS
jgi:hypothetical protein